MMTSKLYAIILAGGSGTRLWPLSRVRRSKQHLALLGRQTLLQMTYRRMRRLLGSQHIFVAVGRDDAPMVRQQLPKLLSHQLLVEPLRRGTGAAIGYGLLCVRLRDPRAFLMTINSDAFLADEARWLAGLRAAFATARKAMTQLVVVGVKPSVPETGYGYIRAGQRLRKQEGFSLFPIESFQEKPTSAVARRYCDDRSYYWNTTVLCGSVAHLWSLYEKHLPETFRALSRMGSSPNPKVFRRLPVSDINYDLLEKADDMLLLAVDGAGWADIGHWRTLHELSRQDHRALHHGPYLSLHGVDNFVVSPQRKLVATVGVSDLLIIDTPDALLVCNRSHAQDVKRVVHELKKRHFHRYV